MGESVRKEERAAMGRAGAGLFGPFEKGVFFIARGTLEDHSVRSLSLVADPGAACIATPAHQHPAEARDGLRGPADALGRLRVTGQPLPGRKGRRKAASVLFLHAR